MGQMRGRHGERSTNELDWCTTVHQHAGQLTYAPSVRLAAVILAALAAGQWASFAAYPGARKLCDQHVSASSMEIAWQSYSTEDPIERVVAFYEKDQKAKSSSGDAGEKTIRAPARADDVLSIIAAERADKLPHCETAPPAAAKTVIVVSSATRRR